MTDIKVILESENIGIESLNKDERELIFDRVLLENPGLGKVIVDSHAEMMNSVITHESQVDKPSLVELLLRKVILNSIDTIVTPAANPYNRIIPIIGDIGINVRFDVYILASRNEEYIVPIGEEINVIGLIVNDYCHVVLNRIGEKLRQTATVFPIRDCKINLVDLVPREIIFNDLGDSLVSLLGMIFDNMTANPPEVYFNEIESIKTRELPSIPAIAIPPVHVKPLPMPHLLESLGTFVNSDELVLLMDIYRRDGQVYERAAIAGEQDPAVVEGVARLHARDARIEFARISKIKEAAAQSLENEYRRIIIKKFGKTRIGVGSALSALTETERKSVLLEVKRESEYLNALANNDCPHVKIYSKLRRAKDIGTIKNSFAALKKFFTKSGGRRDLSAATTTMIICNNCKFNLICPHVVEKIECEIRDCSYSEMKKRLNSFISTASTTKDQQFCETCGEILFMGFDDDSAVSNPMDEELKTFIWGEVAGLIKYLKFGTLIDVTKLITHTRDQIYQHIYDIEKQILKSKTNNADEIKSKKRLYTTMYAMGYFINLIISGHNSAEISFKGFTQKSKNIIADMIRHVIEIILTVRNIAIKSSGMTQDVIKNTMVEVFKTLYSAGQQIITHSGASESLYSLLVLDPIYQYFYRQYAIGQLMNGKKVTDPSDVGSVLGHSLVQLEKSDKNVYADIGIPPQIAKPKSKYEAASYLALRSMVTSQSYLNPLQEYVPDSEMVEMESKFITDLREKYIHLFGWFQVASDRLWKDRHGSLGRIFDESGEKHSFDILIVSEDDKQQEITLPAIARLNESGKKFTAEIIDKKCKICGILWSDVDNLDESKIRESLAEKSGINGFYQFYDQRCPLGGIHEWNNDKCSKCGFSGRNREYYQKYHPTYLQDRRETNSWKSVVNQLTEPPAVEFSFNFNVILDLADKLKVPQRLIMAIGATEKIDYNDIQTGTYVPKELDDRFDTRIFMIDGHIKNFIMEYNQLKHFQKLLKPSADLVAIVDKSKFSRHKIADLATMMPDVSGEYRRKFAYIQMHRKPREVKDFCIQSLCEMILVAYDDPNEETKILRHMFCSYAIKKILRQEELLSKPGYFSWSALYGDKDESQVTKRTEANESSDDDALKNNFDVSDEEADVHVGDEYGL